LLAHTGVCVCVCVCLQVFVRAHKHACLIVCARVLVHGIDNPARAFLYMKGPGNRMEAMSSPAPRNAFGERAKKSRLLRSRASRCGSCAVEKS
jgi:hypothetical protein